MKRLLVTLLTDKKADLDLARRKIGYDHLVLLATPGQEAQARAVQEVEKDLGGCDVVIIDEPDVAAIVARVRALIARFGDAKVTINAAGGTHAMTTALMVYAYETGHPTYFSQEGRHVRLPVFEGVGLVERIGPEGKRVLDALPAEGAFGTDVAEATGLEADRVASVARDLADAGLVGLSARDGRFHLTPIAHADALSRR